MKTILLVKTSSLGDVIHNLPVAGDLRAHFPEAEIHWVAEEAFAPMLALHPAVSRVIPVALRRWRKTFWRRDACREIAAFWADLRQARYDAVLDTQGLLKSALLARCARGPRHGHGRGSAREAVAALFYQHTAAVERNLHAVQRNRLLAARCLGYTPSAAVDYGLRVPQFVPPWPPAGPYAVLLHGTSAAAKLWPEAAWKELGRRLAAEQGLTCLLPWGNGAEQARSRRLAASIPQAIVPPALGLAELAGMLSGCRIAVGVDTGPTHLAAAVGAPTVGIYCATDPRATGLLAETPHVNVGGKGASPDVDGILAGALSLLRPWPGSSSDPP